MSRLKSFAPLSETGLLGQPKDTPMTSLLGIDPSAMRRQALMSGLARAGFTLMGTKDYGDVGAAFLQGANDARDDYQREALLGYQMRNAEEERQYQRDRDAKSDERWQMQWDYNVGRNQKADAWTNTQNQWALDDRQQAEDLRAGQRSAVTNWTQDFTSQGGDLFSPGMQSWLRGQGISGVNPADTQRFDRMQPFMTAGDYPGAFSQMTAEQAAPDPFTLGEGQIRFDGYGNPIAAGPEDQPNPTDDMRELDAINRQRQAAGMPPLRLDEWLTAKSKAGAPQTNIGLEGDSYAKERGKAFATSMGDYEAAERAAFDTLASVDVMRSFMDSPNFYSGWGGQISLNARQLLATMGGNPDAAASVEAFNAESKRMALANMGGSLGTGFSNADRDFVTGQVANLDTSVAGNQALLEINRRVAERKIQIAQMARDYEIQNGRIDARFRQMLSNWALENPLFPEAGDTATQPGQFDPSDPLGIR